MQKNYWYFDKIKEIWIQTEEKVNNNCKPVAHEDPIYVNDLITLSHLHEHSILHTLHTRYNNNLIYTNTGPVLIAINPYKNMDIYNPNNINKKDAHIYKWQLYQLL